MFDLQTAYGDLMNGKPRLAREFDSWRFSVPASITYLFSTPQSKPVYVGTCCKRGNGRTDDRLNAHIVRSDRLSNFGKTYQNLCGGTSDEIRKRIGRLHVRWYEGAPADCKRLEHYVAALDAPMCQDGGIYHRANDLDC